MGIEIYVCYHTYDAVACEIKEVFPYNTNKSLLSVI